MKLEKLSITAFEDDQFTTKVKTLKPLEVLINPEKYKRSYNMLTSEEVSRVTNANQEVIERKIIEPQGESFTLELWFDNTGAIPKSKDVFSQIEKLKDIALRYNGKIHSINFVVINWGTLVFKGQMTGLDVEYQLFQPDGTPLRAKATAKFKQIIDAQTKEEMKLRSSPDLTHVRIVKDGDTLPLMCYRIYKNSKYYLQVALANGLPNFTDLQPGQKIVFPPLER
ncbi:MAG: LysM peptidoglycan-binding domain-containing protein [Bacteroidota bacterium]